MKRVPLSKQELALIAGTRAALGLGAGLLLAGRMCDERRRAIGWTLLAVGLMTTIPIASEMLQLYGGSKHRDFTGAGHLGPGEASA